LNLCNKLVAYGSIQLYTAPVFRGSNNGCSVLATLRRAHRVHRPRRTNPNERSPCFESREKAWWSMDLLCRVHETVILCAWCAARCAWLRRARPAHKFCKRIASALCTHPTYNYYTGHCGSTLSMCLTSNVTATANSLFKSNQYGKLFALTLTKVLAMPDGSSAMTACIAFSVSFDEHLSRQVV